jgi:hypothetical protein
VYYHHAGGGLPAALRIEAVLGLSITHYTRLSTPGSHWSLCNGPAWPRKHLVFVKASGRSQGQLPQRTREAISYQLMRMASFSGGEFIWPRANSSHNSESARMETHTFGFRLRANAPEGQKRFPINRPTGRRSSASTHFDNESCRSVRREGTNS